MKVTRKISGKQILKNQQAQKQKNRRRSRRYVETENQQKCYAQILDNTVNNPYQFSFADYDRNSQRIQLLKTRFDDMIRINGIDLAYFRKFNTFFQDDQNNHANMIYGEDTTAQYYLSGLVRAYLQISKQEFSFNLMGYQATQQIDIWLTIQDFRARFGTLIGKVKKDLFAVPITGDLYNMEYFGYMDIPEFYAQIYGQLNDNLFITNAYPQIKQRPLNSKFYNSIYRISKLQPISGTLNGRLETYIQNDSYVSGILKGELYYHTLDNIQNSPSWQIAPQVGDYFKFIAGNIQEQYEIKQVLDKQITKDGLNPLLGKYLFRCKAIRRVPSQEQHNNIQTKDQIGQDINDMLNTKNINHVTNAQKQQNYPYYTKKQQKRYKQNKRTNNIAAGIYKYQDNQDNVYGGYNEDIPSQQIQYLHEV